MRLVLATVALQIVVLVGAAVIRNSGSGQPAPAIQDNGDHNHIELPLHPFFAAEQVWAVSPLRLEYVLREAMHLLDQAQASANSAPGTSSPDSPTSVNNWQLPRVVPLETHGNTPLSATPLELRNDGSQLILMPQFGVIVDPK
ncbi:MAG: hypothetical protein ABIP94_20350 [Planctomycetota bacterium]